jgi:hypothetical protein
MPQTRPNTWHTVWTGGHWVLQACTSFRGSSAETLSLGWLPAVRFIPWESVSAELPPTVDLRSTFSALSDIVGPMKAEFSQMSICRVGAFCAPFTVNPS